MSLGLGTSMLVQLYGNMKEGRCVPSLQLLNLARDLDICLGHNSSPIETFAADVRPNESKCLLISLASLNAIRVERSATVYVAKLLFSIPIK